MCGNANGSTHSPLAGKPDCALTIHTGSSLPTYSPAIKFNLSVLTAAAISPFFFHTLLITYLPVEPINASKSYISSGQLRITFLCSITSNTSNLNPSCKDGSITRPAVLNGSANILNTGKLNAPGSVLSQQNTKTGSDGLSSNSISATPGPIPLMFPEKVSDNKS